MRFSLFILLSLSLSLPFLPSLPVPSPSPLPPTLVTSLTGPDELHHLPHQIVTKQRDALEERRALSVLVAADLAHGEDDGEAAVDGDPVVLAPLDGGGEALGLSGGAERGAAVEGVGLDVAVRRESGTDRGEGCAVGEGAVVDGGHRGRQPVERSEARVGEGEVADRREDLGQSLQRR